MQAISYPRASHFLDDADMGIAPCAPRTQYQCDTLAHPQPLLQKL